MPTSTTWSFTLPSGEQPDYRSDSGEAGWNPSIDLTDKAVCATQPVSPANPCLVRPHPIGFSLLPLSDYYFVTYFTNNSNNRSLSGATPAFPNKTKHVLQQHAGPLLARKRQHRCSRRPEPTAGPAGSAGCCTSAPTAAASASCRAPGRRRKSIERLCAIRKSHGASGRFSSNWSSFR